MNTYCQVRALALAHDVLVDQLPSKMHQLDDPMCLQLSASIRKLDAALGARLLPFINRYLDGEIAAFELMDIIINMTHEPG